MPLVACCSVESRCPRQCVACHGTSICQSGKHIVTWTKPPAQSACKDSRSHSIGHLETSAPDRRTAPKVCEEQRSHHWSDRNRRVKCVSADSKEAWLSRIERAAIFKFMFPIRLIACSSRSSRRLTRFWSHVVSAPSAPA